jgi:hypothetical protein
MPSMISASFFSLLLLMSPGQVPEEALPPSTRADDFSGAVGEYTIEIDARPREVRVEEPLILRVRIKATGPDTNPEHLKLMGQARPVKLPADYHPSRRWPALSRLKESFAIEELPEKDARPDANTWEFSYRLRPRSTRVKGLPRLEYKFWNPNTRQFELDVSSSLSLRVLPRAIVPEAQQQLSSEERLADRYPLQTSAQPFAHQEPAELPGLWLLGLSLVVPPLLCVAWWHMWRRWYPDAARQAGRRRSKAARLALKALRPVKLLPREEVGSPVAAIVTRYLRERVELSAEEPTPFEAVAHLEQAGIDHALAERFGDLFRACDAARFTADFFAPRDDLGAEAARLIRALEEQPCFSSPA